MDEHYNGSVLSMLGDNCFAIASDTRFGVKQQTISTNFGKIFHVHDSCFLGLAGLVTDIQSLVNLTRASSNEYLLTEGRSPTPSCLARMVAHSLYSRRFAPYFVEPIVAGFQHNAPVVFSMDCIGCVEQTADFVAVGSASKSLQGICESLFEPRMDRDTLFETVSQALLNSLDRDAFSGWGALVTLVTPSAIVSRRLDARLD